MVLNRREIIALSGTLAANLAGCVAAPGQGVSGSKGDRLVQTVTSVSSPIALSEEPRASTWSKCRIRRSRLSRLLSTMTPFSWSNQ